MPLKTKFLRILRFVMLLGLFISFFGCAPARKIPGFTKKIEEIKQIGIAEPDIFLQFVEDGKLEVDLDIQIEVKSQLREEFARILKKRAETVVLANIINDPENNYRKDVSELFVDMDKNAKLRTYKVSDRLIKLLSPFKERYLLLSQLRGMSYNKEDLQRGTRTTRWKGIRSSWSAQTQTEYFLHIALIDKEEKQILLVAASRIVQTSDDEEALLKALLLICKPIIDLED